MNVLHIYDLQIDVGFEVPIGLYIEMLAILLPSAFFDSILQSFFFVFLIYTRLNSRQFKFKNI